MANTIKTLYEDELHTNALYPRTKTNAVSDQDGNVLGNVAVMNYTELSSGVDTIIPGIEMDLLWTNPSPTSSFSAQTISLDLSNYDIFVITTRSGLSNAIYENHTIFKDLGYTLHAFNLPTSDGAPIKSRAININNSSVVFGNGYYSNTVDNNGCIPYKIYGIRGKINE